MLIVVEWCRILSKMAVAITGSPKTSFHWEKIRFEVKISAPFSYLLETSWKNRCAPMSSASSSGKSRGLIVMINRLRNKCQRRPPDSANAIFRMKRPLPAR